MKQILIIGILLFSTPFIYGQETTIKGKIVDYESKTPLVGVNIFENNNKKGTLSNSKGNFELKLYGDSLVVNFQYLGYYQVELNNLSSCDTININELELVRDYSKYVHVELGTDLKPNNKKRKKIEKEIGETYSIVVNGKKLKLKFIGDKIIVECK